MMKNSSFPELPVIEIPPRLGVRGLKIKKG